MPLPKISTHKRAFTLVEILVTTAILTALAGIGLVVGISMYRTYLFHSEMSTVVALLEKARSRAMNNMFQTSHGVHFDTNEYILFRGDVYTPGAPTNESISKASTATITGPADIVFEQLSGDASPTSTIAVSDGLHTESITINNAGRISW